MARFFIHPGRWNLDRLSLDHTEAHHCLDVLRMKIGDRATAFDGRGNEATVEIVGTARSQVDFKVLQSSKTPPLACEITLGQAIPKGKNMEFIIEKATELGTAAIVPFLSDRTIVRLSEDEAHDKRGKWQRVAIEACKQCGQNRLPDIALPIAPRAFFDARPAFDLMLIASLQPGARHIKKVLSEFAAENGHPPARVLVLVGPEGDFTPAEVNHAQASGCHAVTLGPIILRTETAALYCLSVLSHELFATA